LLSLHFRDLEKPLSDFSFLQIDTLFRFLCHADIFAGFDFIDTPLRFRHFAFAAAAIFFDFIFRHYAIIISPYFHFSLTFSFRCFH